MRVAIYPGSFDPVTFGHLDVIKRAALNFDHLVIGVLNNKSKRPLFDIEERVDMIRKVVKDLSDVSIETFEGLLVDFADKCGADVVVRGLRAITDFEYELQMAQTNRKLNPNIDTMFLTTSVEYSYLSSSIVREIARYGGDVSKFVPVEIMEMIYNKCKEREE